MAFSNRDLIARLVQCETERKGENCDNFSIKFVTISENPFINNPDFQV